MACVIDLKFYLSFVCLRKVNKMAVTKRLSQIEEPPLPPVVEEDPMDEGDGDRLQVLFYGEDEDFLKQSFSSLEVMANWIGQGLIDVHYFSDLDNLSSHFDKYISIGGQELVALSYVVSRHNVIRCLSNFLDLVTKVSGYDSTEDIEASIKRSEERRELLLRKVPQSIFSDSKDELREAINAVEPRGRLVRRLNCVHLDQDLSLQGELDFVLDRWSDLGRVIRNKFGGVDGCLRIGEPGVRKVCGEISRHIGDLGLFGDDEF